jgi:hypothetical protein
MNVRYIHIATLVFCTLSLVLGTTIAMEDHEVWGQLQWGVYTTFNALLGAMMSRAARLLA